MAEVHDKRRMMWSRGKPRKALLQVAEEYLGQERLTREWLDKEVSKGGVKLWAREVSKKEIHDGFIHKMKDFVRSVLKEREENLPDYRFYCGFYCVPLDIKSMTRAYWDSEGFGDFDFEWPECVYRHFHRSKTESPFYLGKEGERAYIGLVFASREVLGEIEKEYPGKKDGDE